MKLYWILDELLTPIVIPSDTDARWMQEQTARGEMNLCVVECTEFPDATLVSTVFLGLNHSVTGPPVLFETVIFDPDGVALPYRRSYRTYDEARAGHLRARAHVHAQR